MCGSLDRHVASDSLRQLAEDRSYGPLQPTVAWPFDPENPYCYKMLGPFYALLLLVRGYDSQKIR